MASQFGPYDSYIAAQVPPPPRKKTVVKAAPPPGAAGATTPAYPGALTFEQQIELAKTQANAQVQPLLDEIHRQQQEAAQRNQLHGQAIQGFAGALAEVQKPAAGDINAIYQGAANDTAATGKGYSLGFQMAIDEAAQQSNKLLQTQGAPEGQMLKPNTAAGDVAYGLGGSLPAQSIRSAGTGFAAAARLLPETTRTRGLQDFTANTFAGEDEQATFDAQARQAAAQAVGLTQTALTNVQGQQADLKSAYDTSQYRAATLEGKAVDRASKEADNLTKTTGFQWRVGANGIPEQVLVNGQPVETVQGRSARVLDDARQRSAKISEILANGGYDPTTGKWTMRGRKDYAATFGYDPVTGKPTQRTLHEQNQDALRAKQIDQGAARIQIQLDGLGIREKELALKAATAEWKMKHPASKGGFTQRDIVRLKGDAADSAKDAYNGVPDNIVKVVENGKVVAKNQPIPKRDYQEALRDQLDHGIPLVIAQNALNHVYKVRGERGRPMLAIQERQLLERGGPRAVALLRQAFGATRTEANKALAVWKQTGVPADFAPAEFFQRWRAPVHTSTTTTPVAGADGMVTPGNIDLAHRPVVHNPDGTISTVRSITIEQDGRYVLIPTVVGDSVVSDAAAIDHYKRTGEQLGVFSSAKAADAYAQQLHEQQARAYKGR